MAKYKEDEKFRISNIIETLKQAQTVDVCFLVDCTGSMDQYIDEIKTIIKRGLEKLTKIFKDIQLRFSFIGYRDYEIEIPKGFEIPNEIEMSLYTPKKWIDPANRIEKLAFTTDFEKFSKFVGEIKAGGGGDTCEDVFGG